ncbi:MAG: hypothetical protein AAF492_28420, partial [Verrucomicrobiota bacterium]
MKQKRFIAFFYSCLLLGIPNLRAEEVDLKSYQDIYDRTMAKIDAEYATKTEPLHNTFSETVQSLLHTRRQFL